jgi:hypothetical protein
MMRTMLASLAATALLAACGPRAGENIPPEPQIEFNHEFIGFQIVFKGSEWTENLAISNKGSKELVISKVEIDNDNNGTLAPPVLSGDHVKHGETVVAQVKFTPTTAMTITNANLKITSNAQNTPNAVIPIKGEAK